LTPVLPLEAVPAFVGSTHYAKRCFKTPSTVTASIRLSFHRVQRQSPTLANSKSGARLRALVSASRLCR